MKGLAVCRDCGEQTLRLKEAGLYECLSCGRLTDKKPVPLAPKIKGDWRRAGKK